jgi:hemoglobin/transferrin/lactoferrin receptor protein
MGLRSMSVLLHALAALLCSSQAAVDGGAVLVVSPRDELPLTSSAATVTVITGAELERTNERSLPRAIARAAGVVVIESNLGGGSPVLRGLLGNQVLIVVDGVRLNDSTTRFGPNQSLNTIDPAIVERVEVHHGTSSVLYGSDAIGGVIAIWTKRQSAVGGAAEATAYLGGSVMGQYDTATDGVRGSLELSGAGRRHGWVGIVSGGDWDDLESGNGDVQELTGYHSASAFGSYEHAIDSARTLRIVSWFNRDYDVPRTFQVVPGFGQMEAPFSRYDFTLQEREQTTLTYEDEEAFGIADRLQVRLFARSYYEQRDRQRTGSSSTISGDTDVDTVGFGADFRHDYAQHRLTWGLELMQDDVDSSNERTNLNTGAMTPEPGDFAAGSLYRTFGAFVQDETRLLDPVLLTLGLRWSRYDFEFDGDTGTEEGDFDDLTASIEGAWDVTDSTRLTATLAQGFQAPNLEDLANDGDFAGGVELANPDLEPAKSLMAELGADMVGDLWTARAAVFATRIDDALGRRLLDEGDPGVAGDETYMRANAGRVDLWGVELGATRTLGAMSSPWSVEALASWVRGRQYDDTLDAGTGEARLDGVEARRVPPLTGRVALNWRRTAEPSPAPRWLDDASLSLGFALDQEQLHPDDVTDPRIDPHGSDGWSVWTIEVGGPLTRKVRWSASLVNLFDEEYRVHGSGIEGPGRSAVLSVRASF